MFVMGLRNRCAAMLFFPAVVLVVTAFVGSAALAATGMAMSGRAVRRQERYVDSGKARKEEKA